MTLTLRSLTPDGAELAAEPFDDEQEALHAYDCAIATPCKLAGRWELVRDDGVRVATCEKRTKHG